MNRKAISALVAMTAMPFFVEASSASVTFSYVGIANPVTVVAGNSTQAEVYLKEVLTGGSADVLSANNGLGGAGVALSITGSTGTSATITGFSGDAAFDGQSNPIFTTTTATLTENIGTDDTSGPEGSTSTVSGVTTRLVPLGMLSIGTTGAGTTTFSVGAYAPVVMGTPLIGGNTLDPADNLDYDITSTSPAYTGVETTQTTFTVTATGASVPEPAAMGMIALGGGLLLNRWRRPIAKPAQA
jgi:hypothetical protein